MSGPGGAGTGAGSAAASYVNQQDPAHAPAGAGSIHDGASVSGASLTSFQQVSRSQLLMLMIPPCCCLTPSLFLLQGMRDAQLARQQATVGAGSVAGSFTNQQGNQQGAPAGVGSVVGSMASHHQPQSLMGGSVASHQQTQDQQMQGQQYPPQQQYTHLSRAAANAQGVTSVAGWSGQTLPQQGQHQGLGVPPAFSPTLGGGQELHI